MSDTNQTGQGLDLIQRVFEKLKKPERESVYQEMWDAGWQDRKQIERQWQINMAMVSGNQYIGWSTRLNAVTELKAPRHRMLIVDNRLQPKVRDKISRQMGRPGVQVIPDSKADLDLKRASVKERILKHVERENSMPSLQYALGLWGASCGSAFLDVDWRDEGGASYRDGMDEFYEGEVRIKVRSPWEVWPAPDARFRTWGSWCSIAQLYDVDVARDEFDLKDIRPDGDEYHNPFLQSRMYGFFDQAAETNNMGDATPRHQNQVLVVRMFVFPTNKSPEGKEVLWANRKEQRQSKLSWFPLVHYTNAPYFDRFWGDTEVRQCIPLQKQRNRTRSTIAEYLRTMVKGKYIAHKSNKLGRSSLNTEHLEIVQYEGAAAPPQQMALQSLPTDVWQELAINDASMDDIFANRPSSQGKRETGVNSGVMTAQLQEEDARAHTPGIALYEEALKNMHEKVLDLAAQKYSDKKQIMVVGEDLEWDVQILNRDLDKDGQPAEEDLLGGRNRVNINLGSSLPTNKALRRQMIHEDYKSGLYGDPADPVVRRKVLKQIDAGIVDDIFDEAKLDESKAFEENQTLMMSKEGEVNTAMLSPEQMQELIIPPDTFDDHVIHMKIHNRARKGADFGKMTDVQQEIFNQHCNIHEMLIEQAMMQAAQMENPEAGTPPGGGPGPGSPPQSAPPSAGTGA